MLRRTPSASAAGLLRELTISRPILRDVSRHGVRVYSLCVSCGAHLSASATLCAACARSRSLPNS
jgi:ribosomal protein L40E